MSDNYNELLLRDIVCIHGLPFERVTFSSVTEQVMMAYHLHWVVKLLAIPLTERIAGSNLFE